MGLDITAYEIVVPVKSTPEFVQYSKELGSKDMEIFDGDVNLVQIKEFMSRGYPLTDGEHHYAGKQKSFRAGSYSGYGYYRSYLATLAGARNAEDVWDNPDKYKDAPFYEQINFADNEGFLGQKACAELYYDYMQFKDAAKPNNYLMLREAFAFNDWLEAFGVAAARGIVVFH